ncbi:gas vesicle protein GvpJ [Amycolatopsis lurida]
MPDEHLVSPTAEGLVDLLDRVIDRGAVVSGDVIISLAGIDLIRLDLRLLLCSIDEVPR